jgi:hypothetical protein
MNKMFFEMLDRVNAIAAKNSPKATGNVDIDIDEKVEAAVQKYQDTLDKGIEIGRAQIAEEFGEEEEDEEEEEDKKQESQPLNIDPNASIGEVFEGAVKNELGINVQDIIKSGVELLKNWMKNQPKEVLAKAQPTPEQVTKAEEVVNVGGVKASKEDMTIVMTALNELEKRLAGFADIEIATWIKQSVAPNVIPQLKALTPEYMTKLFSGVKPGLVKDVPRIAKIFKML